MQNLNRESPESRVYEGEHRDQLVLFPPRHTTQNRCLATNVPQTRKRRSGDTATVGATVTLRDNRHLLTHYPMSEFPMTQSGHQSINMAELPGVETRTGANPSLPSYENTIGLTDTMHRSPSARTKPSTLGRIRSWGWIHSPLLDVLAAGRRRGQEGDRELERRCR